jgi:hypothetical protein
MEFQERTNNLVSLLAENTKQINTAYANSQKLLNEYLEECKRDHIHFYTIKCHPHSSKRCTYTVGLFTSVKNATNHVPENGEPFDKDDICAHTYEVTVATDDVIESKLKYLNQSPKSQFNGTCLVCRTPLNDFRGCWIK